MGGAGTTERALFGSDPGLLGARCPCPSGDQMRWVDEGTDADLRAPPRPKQAALHAAEERGVPCPSHKRRGDGVNNCFLEGVAPGARPRSLLLAENVAIAGSGALPQPSWLHGFTAPWRTAPSELPPPQVTSGRAASSSSRAGRQADSSLRAASCPSGVFI